MAIFAMHWDRIGALRWGIFLPYDPAMKRWLAFATYRSFSLFAIMGVLAVVFAWNTIDLAQVAMANFRLITTHGTMALFDGGLVQLAEIAVRGIVSLAAYLGFKACEVELVHRWRSWKAEK